MFRTRQQALERGRLLKPKQNDELSFRFAQSALVLEVGRKKPVKADGMVLFLRCQNSDIARIYESPRVNRTLKSVRRYKLEIKVRLLLCLRRSRVSKDHNGYKGGSLFAELLRVHVRHGAPAAGGCAGRVVLCLRIATRT